MSRLMVDLISSLDAYGTARDWPGLWGMAGPEYLEFIEQDSETGHIALFGSVTYRDMAGFAESAPDDPGLATMTAMPKVVFSSSLQTPLSWDNTKLVTGDAAEAVREMKERESKELRTVGSMALCRSLFEARLVDRLRVVVFPVVNGVSGDVRLFEGYPDMKLELVGQRTFDGQLQLLEYVPTVLDEPPGA